MGVRCLNADPDTPVIIDKVDTEEYRVPVPLTAARSLPLREDMPWSPTSPKDDIITARRQPDAASPTSVRTSSLMMVAGTRRSGTSATA
jgi:hypothetical protein